MPRESISAGSAQNVPCVEGAIEIGKLLFICAAFFSVVAQYSHGVYLYMQHYLPVGGRDPLFSY